MDGSSCVYVFWQHVYVYVVNKCVWRCVYVYVVMFDWYPIRKSVRSGYWVPDRLTNWIPIKHHNLHTHTHTHTHRHTHLFTTYMYTRCQKTYTQELPSMFTTRTLRLSHLMFPSPYRQTTTCSRTRSYSPDDGHIDA